MKKLSFLIFSIIFIACNDVVRGPVQPDENDPLTQVVKPINYGNNVYYFDCIERQFGISLADFLSDTTIYVQAISGDGTDGYGYDTGYFVVIGKK
jgi:hypothetical protein